MDVEKTWGQIGKEAIISLPVIPTVILFLLLAFAFILVARAQARPDFDWADMLRDENGKVSSTRMFSFICLAITSWIMAILAISKELTPDYFWYYLVVWSGTAVALKLVDKWNGTLPFTRGDMQRATAAGAEAAAVGAAAATGNQVVRVVPMGSSGDIGIQPIQQAPAPYVAPPAEPAEPAPVAPPGVSPDGQRIAG